MPNEASYQTARESREILAQEAKILSARTQTCMDSDSKDDDMEYEDIKTEDAESELDWEWV